MSYTPAEWSKANVMGTTLPAALKKSVSVIHAASLGLKNVALWMEKQLLKIEGFLKQYLDPVAPFFAGFTKILETIFKDVMSIGGGAIIITPMNRINKRFIKYSPTLASANDEVKVYEVHLSEDASNSFNLTTPPIEIPAMTPAEAFAELRNSFYNTDDPYRPRWTSNVKTTGFGMLAVGGVNDFAAIVSASQAIGSFFNFPEFKQIVNNYTENMDKYLKDLEESQYTSAAANLRGQGIILENVEYTYEIGESGKPIRKIKTEGQFTIQTDLPSLHWYGLSVENLPGIKLAIDSMLSLLEWINKTTEETTEAIWELFYSIKNRIFAFINLIQNLLDALAALASTLAVTDVYTFKISPEFGGIDHIIQSLQTSIQAPANEAASDISKAWTSAQFSFLVFLGCGGEINVDNWAKMFDELIPSAGETTTTNDYTVLGITAGAVYPINHQVQLEFASENADLVFVYRVKDSNGRLISYREDYINFPLHANEKATPFILTKEDTYTLEIISYKDNVEVNTSTLTFSTSDLIEAPISSPQTPPFTVELPEGFTGTVTLENDKGKVIDKIEVFGERFVILGQTLNTSGLFKIVLINSAGKRLEMFLIMDGKYSSVSFDTLQTTIYSPSVPVYVKFEKSVADIIKVNIDGLWQETKCPGYILFYEYYVPYYCKYYKNGAWIDAVLTVSPIGYSFKDICN